MRTGSFRSGSRAPKGRKRVVREFTVRNGLWILAVIAVVMLFVYLLWGLGIVRFDAD